MEKLPLKRKPLEVLLTKYYSNRFKYVQYQKQSVKIPTFFIKTSKFKM